MAILVTGAAGFVGLNVTEHLLRAGREVVGLDRIELPERARREFPALPGRLSMIGGSVLSADDLARALGAAEVEAVIHCAVITAGVAREQSDPGGIVAVNVQGAVEALVAAARLGVRRFVYPSSQSVYGAALEGGELADEDTERRPLLLYGMTKLACETLLPRIAETQGIGFVSARLASVYGPWEYATGARDTLSPMLSIIELARRGEEAVAGAGGARRLRLFARRGGGAGGAGDGAGAAASVLQSGRGAPHHGGGVLPRGAGAAAGFPLAPGGGGRDGERGQLVRDRPGGAGQCAAGCGDRVCAACVRADGGRLPGLGGLIFLGQRVERLRQAFRAERHGHFAPGWSWNIRRAFSVRARMRRSCSSLSGTSARQPVDMQRRQVMSSGAVPVSPSAGMKRSGAVRVTLSGTRAVSRMGWSRVGRPITVCATGLPLS